MRVAIRMHCPCSRQKVKSSSSMPNSELLRLGKSELSLVIIILELIGLDLDFFESSLGSEL